MSRLRVAEVESSTSPLAPAYATRATRSFSPSRLTSSFNELFTSGSRFSAAIDPDTSTRNTRLLGGRLSASIGRAFSPIRASRWAGAHGQSAISTVTANGSAGLSGALSWYGK